METEWREIVTNAMTDTMDFGVTAVDTTFRQVTYLSLDYDVGGQGYFRYNPNGERARRIARPRAERRIYRTLSWISTEVGAPTIAHRLDRHMIPPWIDGL